MLFSSLTNNQIVYLWNALFYKTSIIDVKENEGNTVEYNESCLFRVLPDTDFVWIKPSGTKTASIDSEGTYVVINGKVARFKDILVKTKTAEEYAHEHFFYLYSNQKLGIEQKNMIINHLKSVAQNVR